jgi:hypothetical protein
MEHMTVVSVQNSEILALKLQMRNLVLIFSFQEWNMFHDEYT